MATKKNSEMRFGWKKDQPDFRDFRYGVTIAPMALPPVADMSGHPCMPPVYNQGACSSCTANAIGGALQYEWRQHQKGPDFVPSRLFIYYNERWLDGDVPYDNGATLRNGMKAINKWGFAKETLWPYVIKNFAKKPPVVAYSDGERRKVYQYSRVNQTRNDLCGALAANQPIVFGFAVYSSFDSRTVSKTGVVPMPKASERRLGGHAVLLVGYDMTRNLYMFRNSYGTTWGQKGYGYLPFEYLENGDLASDFWVVKSL